MKIALLYSYFSLLYIYIFNHRCLKCEPLKFVNIFLDATNHNKKNRLNLNKKNYLQLFLLIKFFDL
jgi:hypothetical protein